LLRTCLFNDHDIDLRPGFENGENDGWFLDMLHNALKTKPYSGERALRTDVRPKAESPPAVGTAVPH